VNWFRSYLNNRQFSVRIFTHLLITFRSSFGVPQGCVLSPLRFNIFIKQSKYPLFGDDVKSFRAVNPVDDCIVLQSDTERIKVWVSANLMKLIIIKIGYCFY
jgi:hypothetical protein